jgi:hypothetical protein
MKSILRPPGAFFMLLFVTASDWPVKTEDQDTAMDMNLKFLRSRGSGGRLGPRQ